MPKLIEGTRIFEDVLVLAAKLHLDEVNLDAEPAPGWDPPSPNIDMMNEEDQKKIKDDPVQLKQSHVQNTYVYLIKPLCDIIQRASFNKDIIKKIRDNNYSLENLDVDINDFNFNVHGVNRGVFTQLYDKPLVSSYSMLSELEYVKELMDKHEGKDLVTVLCSNETAKDDFWTKQSKQISNEGIKDLKELAKKIKDKNIDLAMFKGVGALDDFISSKSLGRASGDPKDDLFYILGLITDENFSNDALKSEISDTTYKAAKEYLEKILTYADEVGMENFYDCDAAGISTWLTQNDFDMEACSFFIKSDIGKEQFEIPGDEKTTKVTLIDLKEEINEANIDHDILNKQEYDELINLIKDTQKLYMDNADNFKETFKKLTSYNDNRSHSWADVKVIQNLDEDTVTKKNLNHLVQNIYKLKRADEKVCKLVDPATNKEVTVRPLEENAKMDIYARNHEANFLDTCVEMLTDAGNKVHRNSSQYKDIISSIKKARDAVKDPAATDEQAKADYIKKLSEILHKVTAYRVHKANTSVARDGTLDKLVACERVEKFIETRLESLDKEKLQSINKSKATGGTDVSMVTGNKELFGKEYVRDKAENKIAQIKENILELKASGKLDAGRKSAGPAENKAELKEEAIKSEESRKSTMSI